LEEFKSRGTIGCKHWADSSRFIRMGLSGKNVPTIGVAVGKAGAIVYVSSKKLLKNENAINIDGVFCFLFYE